MNAEDAFGRLAKEWKSQTRFLSSVPKMTAHPAYQKIIAMGEDAVPMLLRELEREHDFWFPALAAITGENPASDDMAGDIGRICEAWLEWGRQKGYLNDKRWRGPIC